MPLRSKTIGLADEAATLRLAEDIAAILRKGDVLALYGPLGIGKSTFARALIRAMADDPGLEVPSPTFTLVQQYELRLPVAHFDLYRLSDEEELVELGLEEALRESVVLTEWPERAEDVLPASAFRLRFEEGGRPENRVVTLEAGPETMERVERTLAVRRFLEGTGFGHARRRFLMGDASSRAYERLFFDDAPSRVLMNAPAQPDGPPIRDGKPYSRIAHLAEDVVPFVAMARWLKREGFCAPEVVAGDLDAGLLVLEDIGRENFLSVSGEPVDGRYEEAARLLAALHRRPVPQELQADGRVHRIPPYDRDAMIIEVELLLDWYLEFQRGTAASEAERRACLELWNAAIDALADAERHVVLRDYHSPNLIWRNEKAGFDRLGLLDFQDAMIGPSAYDVASLVQDARVTIDEGLQQRLTDAYAAARTAAGPFDEPGFRRALAIMQAQRASKILGIFVRLDRRDGKPVYLKHLPRMRRYLRTALDHESLSAMRMWYGEMKLLDD